MNQFPSVSASASVAGREWADVRHEEGIRETIESIVIALILAFVFRAFIVEAFRIPTGSMAPTLYGAHGKVICADCGYEFAYGVRDPEDDRRTLPVRGSARAVCPNCNHVNTNLRVNDEQGNAEGGDRILVLKWPLDLGASFLEPKRWDVTVFKDPSDGETNFIKRLVGLPNEALMVMDGDLYTVPVEKLSKETADELHQIVHEKYELREGLKRGTLRPVSEKARVELDEKMHIARKTRTAQEVLWFTVYDHDYPPRNPDANQPRWEPALGERSGWKASNRRVRFTDEGLENDFLELRGKAIRASCAYNVLNGGPAPFVNDQRVRFVLTPESGPGVIRLRLEKLNRAFWAAISMDGSVTLSESFDPPRSHTVIMSRSQVAPFRPGQSVEIAFENVDYRLALFIGGREVLASSDDPQSPVYYGPDVPRIRQFRSQLPTVPRMYAEGGDFSLSHLLVERDEYYYTDPRGRLLDLTWAPDEGWASMQHPILLREDEYFMMGDNTAASKDSRLWDRSASTLRARGQAFQLGTVPRDQIIGQAFFVYWPSGFRLDWLPVPLLNKLGIIPDVGRMRWIR